MASRAKDWFAQAERDLDHARNDCETRYYEWACFSAQQAAEKAVKAVFQHIGAEARGHSAKALLQGLPQDHGVTPKLIDCALTLDHYYIPTRCPNGFDHGKPADYFNQEYAEQAIRCADRILRFCADHLSR